MNGIEKMEKGGTEQGERELGTDFKKSFLRPPFFRFPVLSHTGARQYGKAFVAIFSHSLYGKEIVVFRVW